MNGGTGLKPYQLAKMFEPFGIKPNSIWIGTQSKKGYKCDDFEDSFARYLSSAPEGPEGNDVEDSVVREPGDDPTTGDDVLHDYAGSLANEMRSLERAKAERPLHRPR